MIGWLAFAAITAAVGEPAPLVPIGKWQLDTDAQGCLISRKFGPSETPTILMIRPWLTLPIAEVFIQTPTGEAKVGRAKLNGSVAGGGYVSVRVPNDGTRVAFFTADRESLAKDHTLLRIALDDQPEIVLDAHFNDAVSKRLTECEAAVIKQMKLPSLDLPAGATPAVGGSEDLITMDDYPPGPLYARQQGKVSILWTVGTNGRVSDCRVIQTLGPADFGPATCAPLRKRARFKPARSAAGEAIPSSRSRMVSWKLSS